MSARRVVSGIIGGIGLVMGLLVLAGFIAWHHFLSAMKTAIAYDRSADVADVIIVNQQLSLSNYGIAGGAVFALLGLASVVMNYLKKDEYT